MSSLSKRFSTRVLPEDRAARRRHRLERDLDPGRVTVPESVEMGVTVSWFLVESREKVLACSADVEDLCWWIVGVWTTEKGAAGEMLYSSEAVAARDILMLDR